MHNVPFHEARELIQDGDIVFIHGTWHDPIQAVIMLCTASEYSHTCIAFWVESKVGRHLMCVEAQSRSSRRVLPLSFYSDFHMTIVSAPLPWAEVRDRALADVGRASYSLFDAMYVGLYEVVRRLTGKSIPTLSNIREFCSTFVAAVYRLPNRHVSPQQLYEDLRANDSQIT